MKFREFLDPESRYVFMIDPHLSDGGRKDDLALLTREDYPYELSHSLAFDWKDRTLFAIHGHQASRFF